MRMFLVGVLLALVSPAVSAQSSRELVVLVHGLGRSRASMLPLRWALEREGYRVFNWGYSSTTDSIPALAEALSRAVRAEIERDPSPKVHFVGHSLGNILIRGMLHLHALPPGSAGRVVMLAPPNQGARIADRYTPWLGWLLEPLAELTPAPTGTAHRWPVAEEVEVGVIAGARDGKVRVEETHLEGQRDHLVVDAWHTFIMARPSVQRQVVTFLRDGRFQRADSTSSGSGGGVWPR